MAAISNPFITSGKIPSAYFCDRVDECQMLVKHITNGANIVLMSPRRVGKTQLILHSVEQPAVNDHYITIFIDILRTSTLQEFTFELGKAVFNTLAGKGQKWLKMLLATMHSLTGKVTIDHLTGLPSFGISVGDIQNPIYSLEEIFRTLEQAEQRCIIVIEEFQQIATYDERNVEALLRSYIQQSSNAQFIFSGSERHLMEEMFLDSARPFYNSADIMHLDVIALDKYADFVNRQFQAYGKQITIEAIKSVYETFDGNTYYNQKTFREVFAAAQAGSPCTEDDTRQAVTGMLSEAERHYSEVLSRLALPQKELLYAIAKAHHASHITSGSFIRQYSLKSASSVQSSIKKLLSYSLVSFEAGEYYVADQLMRLFLIR